MFRKSLFFLLSFLLLVASQGAAADLGIQFGSKWSTVGGHPTTVGLKVVEDDFSVTSRIGLYRYDRNPDNQNNDVSWVTLGATYDHYLHPGEQLRPYVGGDLDVYFYDNNDSETSFSLNPHFGVEYWLHEHFSVSGEAGLGFGFGEINNVEDPIETTTALHMTYYF